MRIVTQDEFDNPYTLNIFCDASIKNIKKGRVRRYDGCYGAIAIYNDNIIQDYIRISSNTTNNNSEIKAIRAGIELALRYQGQFRTINLFSDSQISLFGLRDRLVNWVVVNGIMYTKAGTPVQSQDIFLEIVYLILNNGLEINLYHQKGHVSSTSKALKEAEHVFRCSNQIRGMIDVNLIKYISKWNNMIDILTRQKLDDSNTSRYKDAITFYYSDFDRDLYSNLIHANRGAL